MTGSVAAGPGDSVLPVSTRPRRKGSSSAAGGHRRVDAEVEITAPRGPALAAVGRLVLAGVGARVELSVRETEDLQDALDLVVRQPAAHDEMTIKLNTSLHGMEVDVGPLAVGPTDQLWLERALGGLVKEIGWHVASGSGTWISMRMSRRSADRSRR